MHPPSFPLVPVLAGPTGSGKTALVCSLDPTRFEVVACDSRQVYAEMPIGTAAPSESELLRMPHHLVAVIPPSAEITAGDYRRLALAAIADTFERGRIPVVVAGTGFYYMALKGGMFPAGADAQTKQKVEALSPEERLMELRRVDPESIASGRIHPNDQYRIRRALEITLSSGEPWSNHWSRTQAAAGAPGGDDAPFRYAGFRLEPSKEVLSARLLERARAMFNSGFVDEAVHVRARYGACPGLRAIGYDLALDCADGRTRVDDAVTELARRHWQYARRQMTWFRREKELSVCLPEAFSAALAGLLG